MNTQSLMGRALQLEAEGKAKEAVELINAELHATRVLRLPAGYFVVPDHRRQLVAARVVFSLLKINGETPPTRSDCAS
jgi:hypothetical protein